MDYLLMASYNLQEFITVKSKDDFVDETMITLIVMTSEAIRFEDLQKCFNAVLNGENQTGLLWNNYVSELVRNWSQFFDRTIPVTTEMVQDLTDEQDPDQKLREYFGGFY